MPCKQFTVKFELPNSSIRFKCVDTAADLTTRKPIFRSAGSYLSETLTDDKSNIIYPRLLRSEDPVNARDETRIFGINLPFFEKLKVLSQSPENAQLQSLLKTGLSTDDTFKLLQLDKAGDKLLSDPNLKRWTAFVAEKARKTSKETMITKLRTQYNNAALVTIIQVAKKGSIKNMATNLQNAQFIGKVLKRGSGRRIDTPAKPIRAAYRQYFKKMRPVGFVTRVPHGGKI
ncbi:hypothetical protein PHMEG_00041614 [Phytophthora megakarya]|uniref:Avirulence (Avh) protein n=1 Tax=Phytophthora megakarya TaxID=4795 RepID=A0A225UB40_9STRA|nr:hypothetical protein PHMEG_00041614 [Phytophthora megakarya]